MRRAFVLIAAALAAGAGTRAAGDDPNPDPDLKKLQGKWRLTYHETAGVEDTQDVVWELEVKGDRYTLTAEGTTTPGTLKLDSTKKPRRLEYTAENDDDTTATFVGVYELDGDTYKTCDVEKGRDERPDEFKTKAKTGQLAVWKRVREKVKD